MNTHPHALPRRTFLRGLGAAIAVPMLDAMVPRRALAAVAAEATPVRMAFMFVPNGMHMPDWTPVAEGADYEMPWILSPVSSFREDFSILSGLTHDKARGNDDGGGDHARSAAAWLTGAQPLKSEGSRIRLGVSVDQYAARAIGRQTRFPSLELGIEPGREAGKCDTGYSCAYSNNLSWRDETTPAAREVNPRLVFERLFASELPKEKGASLARREVYKKSILDFVLEDARSLSSKVGGHDKAKLDQYLTAIREIEQRVENTERLIASERPNAAAGYQMPDRVTEGYEQHARLMSDMMILAFQADTTRICTFMLANEGSNHAYKNIGVTDGHHSVSHHQGDFAKQMMIREINRFHMQQFAYVLERLKSIQEGEGSLLDNTMLVYGAGIADGDRHDHANLPLLLAGRGGGALSPGRHIHYAPETPMCNLLVSMLGTMGVPVERFGDSTGPLRGLDV